MSEDPRGAVEGRARRRASPSGMRTKAVRVEPEPPPPMTKRHEPGTRAAVVYYLCRNHHLEHPHFMEVPLASPQALYLRDVIGRLDALRGKGMAAKYSWSCKRSYKTGFVWHDLSADDLLLPTQGTEYVLKGSELPPFDQSKPPLPVPDHQLNNSTSNAKAQPSKSPRRQGSPGSSSKQGWTSTSPSSTPAAYPAVPVIIKEAVPPPPPPTTTTHATVAPATKDVEVPPPPLPQPPLPPSSPSASTIGDDEQCRLPPHSGSSSNSSPNKSMASSSGTSSPRPIKPTAAAASDAATQTDNKARWDDVKLQLRQDAARASSSSSLERPEIAVVDGSRSMCLAAGELQPRVRRSGTLHSLIQEEAAGRRRCLPLPEEDDRAAAAAAAKGGSASGRLKPANLLMRLMACGPTHPGFGLVQTSSYKPQRFAQLEYLSSPELCPLGALKPVGNSAAAAAPETENCSGCLLDGAALKRSSSSRSHQDGVNNLSRSASKRTSDPPSGRASSLKAVSFRDE